MTLSEEQKAFILKKLQGSAPSITEAAIDYLEGKRVRIVLEEHNVKFLALRKRVYQISNILDIQHKTIPEPKFLIKARHRYEKAKRKQELKKYPKGMQVIVADYIVGQSVTTATTSVEIVKSKNGVTLADTEKGMKIGVFDLVRDD
jgi:hypothetical protein